METEILDSILHRGSFARTVIALQTPKAKKDGLTTSEIAEITGLSVSTIDNHPARELFNAQIVDRIEDETRGRVFKLKKAVFRDGSLQGYESD